MTHKKVAFVVFAAVVVLRIADAFVVYRLADPARYVLTNGANS